MKLLILQGLPGSGKSHFAKKYAQENPNFIRVNRDDLRNMRGRYWLPKQEDLITELENAAIMIAFENKYSVILDATNLNEARTKEKIKIFESLGYKFTVEYMKFNTPIEKCIENDLKRENSVGHKVIQDMYNRYLKPKTKKYVPDKSLPKAFIFDIDGTLAQISDRSPYDWNLVENDTVIEPVKQMLLDLKSAPYSIIIMSGRDGRSEEPTKKWLEKNGIPYDELLMREPEDNRKDSIIKLELFNKVKLDYYVVGVFDDRNQVVELWRDLGLQCYQVADGDF